MLIVIILIDAGKKDGLEVKAERTKCMLLSRHQNVITSPAGVGPK